MGIGKEKSVLDGRRGEALIILQGAGAGAFVVLLMSGIDCRE